MRASEQPWSLTCQGLRGTLEDNSWIEDVTQTQRRLQLVQARVE